MAINPQSSKTSRARRRKAEQHRRLVEKRDLLHLAFRSQQSASARLDELSAEQRTSAEAETCWSVMSLGLDFERRCDVEYCALAGLESEYA